MEGLLVWLGVLAPPFLLGACYRHPRQPVGALLVGIAAVLLSVLVAVLLTMDRAGYVVLPLFFSGLVATSYAAGRFVRFRMTSKAKT